MTTNEPDRQVRQRWQRLREAELDRRRENKRERREGLAETASATAHSGLESPFQLFRGGVRWG
jgi:hypothetical protein